MTGAIVEDMRAVDPVAYIRATGLRPEDSYGFLPIDVNEASSFFFLYRDRPEYAAARVGLPEATMVKDLDFGGLEFGVGQGRQVDVDVPSEAPGGRAGDLIAQAQAMQQQYAAMMPGAPQDPEAARVQQLDQLRDSGVLDAATYDAALYGVQGGHAGPNPGGVPAAPAPADAPPIAIHRLYPRLNKRSLGDQFGDFIAPYRDALGLCPEDVYGVFPRHTLTSSGGGEHGGTATAWEDYWLVYRDRPQYADGRAAWAERMDEPAGWSERLIGAMKKTRWPEAEIVPGVAGPGSTAFDEGDSVEVERDGWPRRALILREKGSDLGDELRERIDRRGYAPEDSFGLCPDFNSNGIYFAWRTR
ncbi:MAG TPA: hypothetical protein VGW10_04105 [Solirubrobacteraceae bacterium]|nr:hypothetical protein [Solirubrobacteraceae bacterium]